MALPTTNDPKPNPTMGPAPTGVPADPHAPPGVDAHGRGPTKREYAPGEWVPPPGWGSAQDTSRPFLSDDDELVDWVILMRTYPHARSRDELRSLALAAGEEAARQAAEATASVDQPVPEYGPDGNLLPPRADPRKPGGVPADPAPPKHDAKHDEKKDEKK